MSSIGSSRPQVWAAVPSPGRAKWAMGMPSSSNKASLSTSSISIKTRSMPKSGGPRTGVEGSLSRAVSESRRKVVVVIQMVCRLFFRSRGKHLLHRGPKRSPLDRGAAMKIVESGHWQLKPEGPPANTHHRLVARVYCVYACYNDRKQR